MRDSCRVDSWDVRHCWSDKTGFLNNWIILQFCLTHLFFTDYIVILDLSDEDGDIKNLHEYPTQYAHRFLKGREVFVLIKVESKF